MSVKVGRVSNKRLRELARQCQRAHVYYGEPASFAGSVMSDELLALVFEVAAARMVAKRERES